MMTHAAAGGCGTANCTMSAMASDGMSTFSSTLGMPAPSSSTAALEEKCTASAASTEIV